MLGTRNGPNVYFDTSAVVAYYCPEAISAQVDALLRNKPGPMISELTEVEFYAAVARKVRQGGLDPANGLRILSEFEAHITGGWYTKLLMEPQHYRMARDWFGQLRLSMRSLDALHLAVAANARATIVTADVALAAVAEPLGVSTVLLSSKPRRR